MYSNGENGKAVRWGGNNTVENRAAGGSALKGSKRFAMRDQPTWKNCKLPRPPPNRNESASLHLSVESASSRLSREFSDTAVKTSSPRRSTTPRSLSLSARSSTSRISDIRARILSPDDSETLRDVVKNSMVENLRTEQGEKGREILKRKAGDARLSMPTPGNLRCRESSDWTSGLWDSDSTTDCSKSNSSQALRRFRIRSAESTHRSPDVSIGLRYISRMLQHSSRERTKGDTTMTRRSSSTLSSLARITSENLRKIRRQSEPAIASPPSYHHKDLGSRTPAPGEDYLEQRRRSSLSAPATRGAESSSRSRGHSQYLGARTQVRSLSLKNRSGPFGDREWRPPNLQKFSTNPPWAAKQQTTRYFPKYSNLQDVHCRNPYLVPGSILYRNQILCE